MDKINQDKIPVPEVYSYHTFYFPFVWDNAGSISMQDLIGKLEQEGIWNDISVNSFSEANDDKVANYQTIQFFTPAARKSLFGWNESFVKCFEYSGIKNKAQYCIHHEYTNRQTNETVITDYNLLLDGIKLKIYSTGIGVLTFEAENRDYRNMVAVKAINEYGRRIFAPYFNKDGVCDICATTLGIKDGANENFSCISTFRPESEELCIPKFITALLPDIHIIPAIDDRMFVASLVNDADELKKHLDWETDGTDSEKVKNVHLNYKTNPAASASLYEFLYIDRDDNCSCHSEKMRNSLLEQSIYDRWAELTIGGQIAGTIFGITHHSMVCLTSATDEIYVERPFLTIYTHMISIVLAQRASILAFDKKVSKCSEAFGRKNVGINTKRIKELKKLQDSYIAFLNQHMNIEVTCQEQGIELYKMLQKEMYVCEEEELLSKELDLLNSAADTANDLRNNAIAILLTVLFGVISILQFPGILNLIGKIITRLF